MLIPCPVCGLRDNGEFTYGGDAGVERPDVSADEKAWASYVYDRENLRGRHKEYWQHVHGCRSWLIVERDTENHHVFGASLAGAWSEPKTAQEADGS